MATTFKTLTANDTANTRTLLHEALPLTGTISSGTYSDNNIKKYSHGMFESVYDYPYLSSSANHIYDIAVGYSSGSTLSASTVPQNAKKINIYSQMAQVLMGHNSLGEIQEFDQDGNLALGGTKHREVFFLNFARLLTKDEIKKGSFAVSFVTGGGRGQPAGAQYSNAIGGVLTLGDYSATSSYYVNSPAGEYGILYTSSGQPNPGSGYGLLFYQAGVAMVTGGIWNNPVTQNEYNPHVTNGGQDLPTGSTMMGLGDQPFSASFGQLLTSSAGTMDFICDTIRNRIQNISFNNTVELNSTIYFCRANHNEFNYSSNPTYLSSSQIRVKNSTSDQPVSYITTVGLYSSDNELLAVAKLSEPLKKDPNTELTLRVRLDY